jgi:hypothetical protein
LNFYGLDINKLASLAGLSASGIRVMLSDGKFRLENLIKIADALNVPVFILFADEILPERRYTKVGEAITLKYQFKDTSQISELNDGTKREFTFLEKGNAFGIDEAKYQEMEQKVQDMELEFEKKNEKIKLLEEYNQFLKDTASTYKKQVQNLTALLFNDYEDKS